MAKIFGLFVFDLAITYIIFVVFINTAYELYAPAEGGIIFPWDKETIFSEIRFFLGTLCILGQLTWWIIYRGLEGMRLDYAERWGFWVVAIVLSMLIYGGIGLVYRRFHANQYESVYATDLPVGTGLFAVFILEGATFLLHNYQVKRRSRLSVETK